MIWKLKDLGLTLRYGALWTCGVELVNSREKQFLDFETCMTYCKTAINTSGI
jgi:hypothetical protein